MPEVAVAPVEAAPVVEPTPAIYGGVSPTVEVSFDQPQSHQIYGGADPLENTQTIPTVQPQPVEVAPVVTEPVMVQPVEAAPVAPEVLPQVGPVEPAAPAAPTVLPQIEPVAPVAPIDTNQQ